jgi:hypothetical protein
MELEMFKETRATVYDGRGGIDGHDMAPRGAPPQAFLLRLCAWGFDAPADIFAVNDNAADIYVTVKPHLAPSGWRDAMHRRCVMLEVLRVLAGAESSWRWDRGRDVTNPNTDNPINEETGIFQVSADSMAFGAELRNLVKSRLGNDNANTFIRGMKVDYWLAFEYTARLLRRTIRHHGPVKRGEILPWLRIGAVEEFRKILTDFSK